MKEYFLCKETPNFKAVGNVYPQCCNFIKNLPEEKKELVYIASDAMTKGDIAKLKEIKKLVGLRLSGKLTDYLSSILPYRPVFNQKVVNILSKFRMGEHYYLPMEINYRGEVYIYYALYCNDIYTKYVDFAKSEFEIFSNNVSEENKSKILNMITDRESFIKAKQLIYFTTRKVQLRADFPSELDTFVLPKLFQETEWFASKVLCETIENSNISGIEINREIKAIHY